jgi:RimJ/RimL family protein N-acetyltransferase
LIGIKEPVLSMLEKSILTGSRIILCPITAKDAAADDRTDYAIVRKSDLAYIGEVVLNDIDWTNRTVGFRIALAHRKFFGNGFVLKPLV